MTDIRKVTVRVAGDRSLKAVRELNEEAELLRDLLDHATEFTFRPDFGPVNDEFSDDPEGRDAVVLAWRGPSEKGADPDRWAILRHERWCWSRSRQEFVFEPRPSSRDDDFFGDHRFSLDDALELVPGILRRVEARRVPELRAMVEARAERQTVAR